MIAALSSSSIVEFDALLGGARTLTRKQQPTTGPQPGSSRVAETKWFWPLPFDGFLPTNAEIALDQENRRRLGIVSDGDPGEVSLSGAAQSAPTTTSEATTAPSVTSR